MASPRERADRLSMSRPGNQRPQRRPDDRVLVPSDRPTWRPDDRVLVPSDRPTWRPDDRVLVSPERPHVRRHHFHDVPPWPHQHYRDYVYVDRGGWWPRWYPYWDPQWYVYWWSLYDYYGGDAYPEYAEYARDAALRQNAPQWGLVISGNYPTHALDPTSAREHHDGSNGRDPRRAHPSSLMRAERHEPEQYRPHYQHPHYTYGDYVVVNGAWWPRWFPYWDPTWFRYWWQLYDYYGGDAHRDYAEYARDAKVRSYASQLGWIQ